MENLIYWQGVAVGIDCGRSVAWFSNATPEIIKALS